MKKFKKLLAGVCVAAFCLTTVVMPVSAESKNYYSESGSYEYVLSSYTQPSPDLKSYDDATSKALAEQCRVKNPSSLYMDTAIRDEAEKAIKNKKYVYDFRYMAEFGLFRVIFNDKIFSYGIYISDVNYLDSCKGKAVKEIIKCSKKDYEDFFYAMNNRKMKKNEYEFNSSNDYTEYEKYFSNSSK